MIGTILLWLWACFAALWTLNWLWSRHLSRGHFWAIIEVACYWALAVYFFANPDVSRLHIFWAAPATYVAAFVVSGVFLRAVRRDEN